MGHTHQHPATRRRTAHDGDAAARAADDVAAGPALQRAAGNRAVSELIAGAQARLTVGSVDDPLEREADAIADQVVHAIRTGDGDGTAAASAAVAHRLRREPSSAGGSGGGSGDGSAGGSGAAGGELDAGTERAIAAGRGGGQPLPDITRKAVEGAFGADFGEVRVHTGRDAAGLNDAVGAEAFTVGRDVFFRDGVPDATDPLLAHELTHVVQQGGAAADTARRKPAGGKKAKAPRSPDSMVKLGTSVETKVETAGETTTTTKDRKAQAGVGKSVEKSSDVFDGSNHVTSASEHEFFAGAEAACKTISTATPGQIKEAVELMARAGVFGSTSQKAAIERGPMKASAEGSAEGKVGAEAELKASVTLNADLFHALVATIEAGAQVGAQADLKAQLEAGLGPLAVGLEAQLSAFAGAMVKASATLDVGITHLYAEAEAKAFAGAKADASGEISIKLGDAAATAALEGSAMAGAAAEAKGSFKIDLSGVEASGKVEAFAGVKATAEAKGGFSYQGRPIFSASGKIGVSAGVGGSAEGSFGFRRGKLSISGDLAGALGIGAEVGAELEIDFYELALMIEDLIVRAFMAKKEEINRSSPKVERVPIIDQALAAKKHQEGYDTYRKDFAAYDAKKQKQGRSGIKRERVQEIIDKRWNANKNNWQYLEFDQGVIRAAKEMFGSKLVDIDIQAGQLRAFNVTHTEKEAAHLKKQRMKQGAKS